MLPLPISRLVELHVRSFSVELDVLSFFLPYHDGIFEMYMDDDDQFACARLEEEVLHVAEKHIDIVPAVISIS